MLTWGQSGDRLHPINAVFVRYEMSPGNSLPLWLALPIAESVVSDEQAHFNFGETWLKQNFEQSKTELKAANKQNRPPIWRMLKEVEVDISTLGIRKDATVEEFIMDCGSALYTMGFSTYKMLQMTTQGWASLS